MLHKTVIINKSPLPDISPAMETNPMRMFETVTSSALAIAAQALVVGLIVSAL